MTHTTRYDVRDLDAFVTRLTAVDTFVADVLEPLWRAADEAERAIALANDALATTRKARLMAHRLLHDLKRDRNRTGT